MFYRCKKCNKEVSGSQILGVISDDDELESLTHIKCKGKVVRSNWTKNTPTSVGCYWWRNCEQDVI